MCRLWTYDLSNPGASVSGYCWIARWLPCSNRTTRKITQPPREILECDFLGNGECNRRETRLLCTRASIDVYITCPLKRFQNDGSSLRVVQIRRIFALFCMQYLSLDVYDNSPWDFFALFFRPIHFAEGLLCWENIFGLSQLTYRPNIPVLLGWNVKNTDTPLKIHPVVFRGLSGADLRFSSCQK